LDGIEGENVMEHMLAGNIDISRLTLGTAQLGLDYGIANTGGKPGYKKANEILDAATSCGVNCFDTAPSYGDSEKIIGSYLSSYPKSSPLLVIVTKMPPINQGGRITPEEIYGLVRRHITESAKRLQIKKIPVYLLHRAPDINAYEGLVFKSLLKLRDEGSVGVLGVSVYNPEEVEQALELEAIKAIQAPVNIFDHRLIKTGLLDKLRGRDFIVWARSIFLQGLFFLDAENLPACLEFARKPLRQLKELSAEQGKGIAELALTFVRDIPGITSVVIGAETPGQVRQDVDLMKSPLLSPKVREEIMDIFSNLPLELINPSLWLPELYEMQGRKNL
jgi:aryl-alcohol dehydrogenase-like predicted oxidoreductase